MKNKILELGDVIEFKMRFKQSGSDENHQYQNDQKSTITLGKNELIIGLDEEILNKKIELDNKGIFSIQNFELKEDWNNYPKGTIFSELSFKVYKHQKNDSKEIFEPTKKDNVATIDDLEKKVEKMQEQNFLLQRKIETLEEEKNKQIEDFKSKINALTIKAQEETTKLKDEIKERAKEELAENKKFAIQKVVEDLLNPLNNLYLSVEFGSKQTDEKVSGYVKGFQLTLNQIFDVLSTHGVEIIEPKEKEEFNPEIHHVHEVVENADGFTKDQIVKIISRGYKLNGRVIKPAIVNVAK